MSSGEDSLQLERQAFRAELSKIRQSHLYEEARLSDRAVVDLALMGLKSLLLVNGGALIAMLTFLGNVQTEFAHPWLLWFSFATFVSGLVLALVATILGYFAQSAYSAQATSGGDKILFSLMGDKETSDKSNAEEDKYLKEKIRFRIAAITLAILSAFTFCAGSGVGILALSTARISAVS